jgi:hypothetical protein
MSEEIVEQSSHSGEALYNILPSALSKHDETQGILTVVSNTLALLPSK